MSKSRRFLERLLKGNADRNIGFPELCNLLNRLGFKERVNGSHHIFSMDGVPEILNLQPRNDGKAKPYQVKQIRHVITQRGLQDRFNEN